MPATSLDTFANTNPAFCALVLRSYVEGYATADPDGVPVPLMLLPLPVVLSADIASSLTGLKVTTGLLTWVARHPRVTIDLRQRVTMTARFSREALLFGVVRRVLGVTARGRVVLEAEGLVKKVRFPASEERGRALADARLLGRWVADARSAETVLACLGMNR